MTGIRRLLPARAADVDWEGVYADQLPRVYNFFRYRVEDGATAEDLTAATFEKAWRGRARYRSDLAAFSTWLFSIARNTAADYYRNRRADAPLDERTASDERAPDEAVERRDDFQRLGALLAALSERERELLALKYGAGLTNRAIADVMGLSESNVGTIAQRAVAKLRAQWDEQGENHG